MRPTLPLVLLLATTFVRGQQYEWRSLQQPFTTTNGAILAWDAARHRMVAQSGTGTWLADGAAWHRRGTLSAGAQPGLAFDRARANTILFGGSSGGLSAQTWRWNGATWSLVNTAVSPPGRWFSPLAYDVVRQRIVLCGGETQAANVNDTWEFDGTNWLQRFPATSPSSHGRHGLAYDEARNVTVLFGGMAANGQTLFAETWEWDGVNWTRRLPAVSPPARRNHGMAWDATRSRTVVFGGIVASGAVVADTWEYDGLNWTQVAVGQPGPPSQISQSIAGDPDRGVVVAMEWASDTKRTWAFDGTAWRVTITPPTPGVSSRHAMAHDPQRGETLLFGNWFFYAFPSFSAQTWVQRGGAWQQRAPATSPPFAEQPALAFDPVGSGIVLFGGLGLPPGSTWRWDGITWHALATGISPPPRHAAAMAADLGRGRVVLFGGDDGTGAARADTWEWNGSAWLQRSPPMSPPGREGHAMAYDPGRARTVLFGGGDVLTPPTLGDCWEWDGLTWSQVTGSLPPPRTSHSLVFDTASNRILLLGGQFLIATAFGTPQNDLWEWDGVLWTPRTVAGVVPATRLTTVAAHDVGLARTFVFSGEAEADSWLLGPVSTARAVGYGNACPGSFGVPELHAVGEPFVGNGWFGLQGTALVPGALGFVGISTLPANVPLASGCTALVDQPSWFGATADARGVIDLRMPIPNLASLHGAIAFAQAVAFDPNGSLAGFLALSAGLRATLD